MLTQTIYQEMKAKLSHIVPDVELFYKAELAEKIIQLKREHHLTDLSIRLIKHTYVLDRGERTMWEVYVKARRGVKVLFPKEGS